MISRTRIILALAAAILSFVADSKSKDSIKNQIVRHTTSISR